MLLAGTLHPPGITLQDFASLKNRIIDSERNGYGTELNDILSTIDEQTSDGFWMLLRQDFGMCL